MHDKTKVTVRKPETKRGNPVSQTRKTEPSQSMNSPGDRLLFLQRTIGNQAVRRIMKSGALQAKLRNSISCPVSPRRCPFGGACHTCPAKVQAKFRIGQPGVIYEQEADQVTKQTRCIPEPRVQQSKEEIQVKPITTQITPLVQKQVEEEEKQEEEEIQSKPLDRQTLPRSQAETEEEEDLTLQPEEEEEGPVCGVQEKLTMGTPRDIYEQEADRIAEDISSEGALSDLSTMTSVQKRLLSSIDPRALGGLTKRNIGPRVSTDSVGPRRIAVNRKQGFPLQRDGSIPPTIERRILQSKGSGSRLSPQMNAYMSLQTGYDFSKVRVKADSEAAALNRTLGARAFTNGSDIWLGKGEKATDVKLMAHELTHVVQQGAADRIHHQSIAFSQLIASKGYMPKFMQALTKNANGNSALFQKGILQFINKYPSNKMNTLQAQLLDGAKSDSINRRESAQTLRGSIPSCKGSSGSKQSSGRTATLKRTVTAQPTNLGCGGFTMAAIFSLDNANTKTNGFVVQKVRFDLKREKCAGGRNDFNSTYWEAWQVRRGVVYIGTSKSRHDSDGFGDRFTVPPAPDHKGNTYLEGKAKYIDGYTAPLKWGRIPQAGSLPATTTQPAGWSDTGTLHRYIGNRNFNCCSKTDLGDFYHQK